MDDQEKTAINESEDASEAEKRLASRLASLEEAPDPKEVSKILKETAVEPVKTSFAETGDLMDMVRAEADTTRGDVSAATIGRMLGLVTTSDFRLLEGKVDLLATRMNSIILKLEKANTILMGAPSGSDLERIDVQIGSLRTMIREMVEEMQYAKEASSPLVRKSKMQIQTSTKPEAVKEVAPPADDKEEKDEGEVITEDPAEE